MFSGVSGSPPVITNSILWKDIPDEIYGATNEILTYCDIQEGYQGEGNFHGDPLFVDPDNGDFHLSVSSPCMYSGTSLGAPNEDLENNPRPQGYGFDIGAYQTTGYDELRPIIDSFTANTSESFVPFEVYFVCDAHDPDGEIVSYTIDYGDGGPSEMNTSGFFTHIYTAMGVGYATCTVTDDTGASTNSFSIRIRRKGEIHVPDEHATIQAAIDRALDGDIVVVADGTYKGVGNKNLDFKGKAITVRSLNGPQNCTIDCENDGRGFHFHSAETKNAILSGFTITKGNAGGILCSQSSPTIMSCIIKNNSNLGLTGSGGGIHCASTASETDSPTIANCVIINNTVWSSGGGIYCSGKTSPKIINCTIAGNSCYINDEQSGGGGIFWRSIPEPIITNSIISGNSPNEIKAPFGSGTTVTYSNIKGGWKGEGNIGVNAAFLDKSAGNYRLADYSPCIGAGTLTGAPAKDIAGNARPSPAGSYPDMGAYESPLAARTAPPLDIFGMAVDNEWVFEGTKEGNSYKVERKVTMDTSTFPIPTYAYEIKENGVFSGKEYYQKSSDQVLLWGASIKDEGFLYDLRFSSGLPVIRLPVVVGDHQYSFTTGEFTQFPGYTFNVSMDVLVMTQETVDLGFDTFEAYKVRYEMRVWGQGLDYTDTFFWWVVPYIGTVEDEDADSMVKLTSFAIGEGTITHQSDADRDGLRDYQEILKGQTDWLDGDTDDDGCLDGPELQGGRNPLIADPEGDVNGDCGLNIADAISALRVITGIDELGTSNKKADVNGDGKIGTEELIWILQRISGSR
jgi:parallel beta-helix repeat protein